MRKVSRPARGRLYPNLKASLKANPQVRQCRAAADLGLTAPQLNRYVHGARVPRPETCVKLAEYFHVPVASFALSYLKYQRRMRKLEKWEGAA